MSKAINSPTARLLQSSRLFSLPRALPQPILETITSTGLYRGSDTATFPYPTLQAVATPPSSLSRGDWGLKRPLPAKATSGTSTPHIRISAQDTREHVTDFSSAADHTQTLAKWRQLDVPVLRRQRRVRQSIKPPPNSAFDDDGDNTDLAALRTSFQPAYASRTDMGTPESQRWKFKGPWIAGMQEGEFAEYIVRAIRTRKHDWYDFLRQDLSAERLLEVRRRAQDKGEPLIAEQEEGLKQELMPSDTELKEFEKRLRDEHTEARLSSRLTALICDFLDLPGVATEKPSSMRGPKLSGMVSDLMQEGTATPPTTHPSAGLSYIRTNAVMENHPVHGPQKQRAPVQARVVRTRLQQNTREHQAKIGIAGVVTNDPISSSSNRGGSPEDGLAHEVDPDLVGGNKMWMHAVNAVISDRGMINLDAHRGEGEAVAVKINEVQRIHDARAATSTRPAFGGYTESLAPRGTAANANYGKALPDMRRFNRVTGFDTPGPVSQESQSDALSEAATPIREYLEKVQDH